MKARSYFFILCLLSLFFTLSVMAQQNSPFGKLFPENFLQDSLYHMTPTEDGQMGFHLWIRKPSFEANMPIKKYDEHMDEDMNRNPLKPAPQQMPNALDDDLHLLPELKPKD